MPETPHKVVRHGRHEMEYDEAAADGTIRAGDVLTLQDDGTVTQATSLTQYDRLIVADDARGRGIEQGDQYADGELVRYLILGGGGGVTVNMADGETLDVSAETRLVLSGTAGRVRPFSADDAQDPLFEADEESDITASGSHEAVDAEVI